MLQGRLLVLFGAVAGLLLTGATALGQFGVRQPETVFRNATVFDGERFVTDCDILIQGKKIKAVGPDLEVESGATEIDLAGKVVMPPLVDASSRLGLAVGPRAGQPRQISVDGLDVYDRDAFRDALESGVAYGYLPGAAAGGAGSRGQAILITGGAAEAIEGTEALHLKVGTRGGPIARRAEIEGLDKFLESAEKYEESWKKYRKDLEKYEKDLAEWVKSGKKGSSKAAETKKDAASPRPGARRPARPTSRPRPRPGRGSGVVLGGYGMRVGIPGLQVCTDQNCHIVGLHALHDHDSLAEDGHDHDHDGAGGRPEAVEPGYLSVYADPPLLQPLPTHLDDGTEPHLRWPEPPSRRAASQQRTSVCPHCGSDDPLAPEHLDHSQMNPFDPMEFAPGEDETRRATAERIGGFFRDVEGPPSPDWWRGDEAWEDGGSGDADHGHGDEDHGDGDEDHDHGDEDHGDHEIALRRDEDPKPAAKPDAAKKDDGKKDDAKKGDGPPKKPREPRYDPNLELVAKALAGKLRVRIEAHRADDILNVLALLEKRPMDAVLEGATEGRFVAEALAKAELPVVVKPEPVVPEQELSASGRGGRPVNLPFELPPGFELPRQRGPSVAQTLPAEGQAAAENAARLERAGVEVAIASLGEAGDATPRLLVRAALAKSQGMSRERALEAITLRAARILGLDGVGKLEPKAPASMIVLDGDPFLATTRVERVYIEGKVQFEN